MKKVVLLLFVSITMIQCANETKIEAKLHEEYIVEEELTRYALTALDSVYSVQVKLKSQDSAVVKYWVELDYNGITYQDSLNFALHAGETANGQIIFSECPTKNQPKPTLTSKAKRLE